MTKGLLVLISDQAGPAEVPLSKALNSKILHGSWLPLTQATDASSLVCGNTLNAEDRFFYSQMLILPLENHPFYACEEVLLTTTDNCSIRHLFM